MRLSFACRFPAFSHGLHEIATSTALLFEGVPCWQVSPGEHPKAPQKCYCTRGQALCTPQSASMLSGESFVLSETH
jgi:hypothetical protein